MYPVPPVRNIATLLRSSPSSPHRHFRALSSLSLASAAAYAARAPHALPADALQSADTSTAAVPEYECRSNTPTSPVPPCHIRKVLSLRASAPATTFLHYPRQSHARSAEYTARTGPPIS